MTVPSGNAGTYYWPVDAWLSNIMLEWRGDAFLRSPLMCVDVQQKFQAFRITVIGLLKRFYAIMQGPEMFASYNVEVLVREYMRWIRQDPVWMYKLAEFNLIFFFCLCSRHTFYRICNNVLQCNSVCREDNPTGCTVFSFIPCRYKVFRP